MVCVWIQNTHGRIVVGVEMRARRDRSALMDNVLPLVLRRHRLFVMVAVSIFSATMSTVDDAESVALLDENVRGDNVFVLVTCLYVVMCVWTFKMIVYIAESASISARVD